MRIPTVALAVLALAPLSAAQSADGVVEFRSPRLRAAAAPADAEPPKLGVMVSETEDGVLISEIFEDSLADHAGVQADDILFKISGDRVGEIADIPELLAGIEPGQAFGITVIRPGEGLVTLRAHRPKPQREERIVEQDGWTSAGGAFLGVELGDAGGRGARVAGVIDGTAAWYAGLSDGDSILAIDGHEVGAPEDVAKLIGHHAPGDIISLTYAHGDRKFENRMRLGRRQPAGMPLGFLGSDQNEWLGQLGGNAFFVGPDGDVDLAEPQDGNAFVFRGGDPGGMAFSGKDHEGNLFFHGGEHGEHDGNVFFVHPDEGHDVVWFDADGESHDMAELHERIQKQLKGTGVDAGKRKAGPDGARKLRIQIEDGVMTVERDGEVEVIELDADDDRSSFRQESGAQQWLANVNALVPAKVAAECDAAAACEAEAATCAAEAAECAVAASACAAEAAECSAVAAERVAAVAQSAARAASVAAQAVPVSRTVAVVAAPACEAVVECDGEVIACEVAVACEAETECEVESACEVEVDCETECEVEVSCEDESADACCESDEDCSDEQDDSVT